MNWNSSLFDRPFAIRFLGAYQPHIFYRQPNVPVIDQGGVGFGPLGAAASPSVRLTGLVEIPAVRERHGRSDGALAQLHEPGRRSHAVLGEQPRRVVRDHERQRGL